MIFEESTLAKHKSRCHSRYHIFIDLQRAIILAHTIHSILEIRYDARIHICSWVAILVKIIHILFAIAEFRYTIVPRHIAIAKNKIAIVASTEETCYATPVVLSRWSCINAIDALKDIIGFTNIGKGPRAIRLRHHQWGQILLLYIRCKIIV